MLAILRSRTAAGGGELQHQRDIYAQDKGKRTGEIVISGSTNSGQPVVVYRSGTGQ
jgi:hypothetical protein